MTDLKGNSILLFAPQSTTKHYGDSIKAELESRGAVVSLYDERPSQRAINKIITRLTKNIAPQVFNKYLKKVIDQNKEKVFSYILICRAEAFTPQSIELLRQAFPKAKIILYLWDTLTTNNKRNIIGCCDKAFSFDPADCEEIKELSFRPTFFVPDYALLPPADKCQYELSFIGSLHLSRWETIKRFRSECVNRGYKPYFYLYIPSFLYYIRDIFIRFPYAPLHEVHFHPISHKDSLKVVQESKCILDINYSFQKSLSTRPYEAMASGRKLITTNPEIKKYDFYNSHNILVVEIKNPQIPQEFMNDTFEPVPEEIRYKYSVKGLVDDLFS